MVIKAHRTAPVSVCSFWHKTGLKCPKTIALIWLQPKNLNEQQEVDSALCLPALWRHDRGLLPKTMVFFSRDHEHWHPVHSCIYQTASESALPETKEEKNFHKGGIQHTWRKMQDAWRGLARRNLSLQPNPNQFPKRPRPTWPCLAAAWRTEFVNSAPRSTNFFTMSKSPVSPALSSGVLSSRPLTSGSSPHVLMRYSKRCAWPRLHTFVRIRSPSWFRDSRSAPCSSSHWITCEHQQNWGKDDKCIQKKYLFAPHTLSHFYHHPYETTKPKHTLQIPKGNNLASFLFCSVQNCPLRAAW